MAESAKEAAVTQPPPSHFQYAPGCLLTVEHLQVEDVAEILRIGCSAYGFTSTLPPDQAECVLEAIDMVCDEPERRQRLWDNQRYFVSRLAAHGLAPLSASTPIVHVGIGDEDECVRVAAGLRACGVHVDAIRFPAIAPGQSRLRFIMNAHHTHAQIDGAAELVEALLDDPLTEPTPIVIVGASHESGPRSSASMIALYT